MSFLFSPCSGGFHVHGISSIHDGRISVTELPLKEWTNNFKERLDKLMKKSSSTPAFVKRYHAKHNETDVNFDIEVFCPYQLPSASFLTLLCAWDLFCYLPTIQLNRAKIDNSFSRKLGLESRLSLSNMHLQDGDGKIQKFSDPLEIVDAFMPIRMHVCGLVSRVLVLMTKLSPHSPDCALSYWGPMFQYYGKRLEHLKHKLGEETQNLTSRAEFCQVRFEAAVRVHAQTESRGGFQGF